MAALPAHIKAVVMALVNTTAPNPPADPNTLDDLERLPWEKRCTAVRTLRAVTRHGLRG